jgi:hypothetical protein
LPDQAEAPENNGGESELDDEPPDGALSDAAPNAPIAGDISASNALLDDDELAAALAEIEKTPLSERDQIPDLDDGQSDSEESEPADAEDEPDAENTSAEPDPERQEDGAENSSTPVAATESESDGKHSDDAEEAPESADSVAVAEPEKPKVRFSIGKKSSDNDDADGAPKDAVETAREALASPQTPPAVKKLVRAIDRGLETLNQPFAQYGDSVRSLIGWCAVATIIASLLAMFTLPTLLPRRDAITYLKETRSTIDRPAPPPVADETEEGAG